MSNLSELDLNVRRWLITQKVSELSAQYSESLRLGKPCALKERDSLLLLEGILDLLKCYQYLGVHILEYSTGTITVGDNKDGLKTFGIYINNELIQEFTITNPDVSTLVNTIVNGINDAGKPYIVTSSNNVVTITSIDSGEDLPLDIITTNGEPFIGEWEGLNGNQITITESDNCYTEQELQTLLDEVSEKYDLNFKPINYTYEQ